ncbi:hypothetical protein BDZ97DRAFT_1762890 [Flammula alnicola]|nr:hypothetical protein BDZ97DRAFT_1762890 [Flammula alnicola]
MGRDGETRIKWPLSGFSRTVGCGGKNLDLETFRCIEHISARSTTKIERWSFRVWAVSWPARGLQTLLQYTASIASNATGEEAATYAGEGQYRGEDLKLESETGVEEKVLPTWWYLEWNRHFGVLGVFVSTSFDLGSQDFYVC